MGDLGEEARVRVAVRLRPYNEKEKLTTVTASSGGDKPAASPDIWLISGDGRKIVENSQVVEDTSNFFAQKEFLFDHVFGADSRNSQVYESLVLPVVSRFVGGFNGTVFAYGQTSSGKTHTLIGTAKDPGTLPLAIHDAFKIMSKTDRSVQFLIRVSYMEIYNDQLSDLLEEEDGDVVTSGSTQAQLALTMNEKRGFMADLRRRSTSPVPAPATTNSGGDKLRIREAPKTGWFVEGLKEFLVKSPEEALAFMAAGERRKHIAETNMNQRSSRSHTIFRLTLESKREGAPAVVSILNLVDLAGSESVKKAGTNSNDERFKEGTQINRSLLTLGTVIHKLSEMDQNPLQQPQQQPHVHIPYRDSCLTKVLANSLGGNANTAVVAALSPALYNLQESRNTLLFASRAAKIVNRTEKVLLTEGSTIEKYRREIEQLRRKLAEMQVDGDRELDAEKRLKDIEDLLRISSESDVDEHLVLEGLRAVTMGQRTLAEVADELGLDPQVDGVMGGMDETVATHTHRRSSTMSRRSSLVRHMSSLEIESVVRLSDMHQQQVRSECGPDALVRTLSPSGSPLTTPLSSRRLWTPCKDMFSSSDEQDDEVVSALRSAAATLSPNALHRMLSSPDLAHHSLVSAAEEHLLQHQQQQQSPAKTQPAAASDPKLRTQGSGEGPSEQQAAAAGGAGGSRSPRLATPPRRSASQRQQSSGEEDEEQKRRQQEEAEACRRSEAVQLAVQLREECSHALAAVEQLSGLLRAMSDQLDWQQGQDGGEPEVVAVPLQDVRQLWHVVEGLSRAAQCSDQDATCLVTEVLYLHHAAGPLGERGRRGPPTIAQPDPATRMQHIIRRHHLHRGLQDPVLGHVTPCHGTHEQQLSAELAAAKERASVTHRMALRTAMAAVRASEDRCYAVELEARRRLQAAKTATAVRRMPPTVQQEPGGVTWPTGEPPQASRPDWGHSIISITARRVR